MRIRKWPINCCTFSLNIHKVIPSVDYNQWLIVLDTQLDEPTNPNSIKFPKVVMQINKKRYFKSLVTFDDNDHHPSPFKNRRISITAVFFQKRSGIISNLLDCYLTNFC